MCVDSVWLDQQFLTDELQQAIQVCVTYATTDELCRKQDQTRDQILLVFLFLLLVLVRSGDSLIKSLSLLQCCTVLPRKITKSVVSASASKQYVYNQVAVPFSGWINYNRSKGRNQVMLLKKSLHRMDKWVNKTLELNMGDVHFAVCFLFPTAKLWSIFP